MSGSSHYTSAKEKVLLYCLTVILAWGSGLHARFMNGVHLFVPLTVALFVTAVALLDKEAHQAILKIHPLSMSSSICFNSSAMTVNTGTALLTPLAAAPLKIAKPLLLFGWK